MNVTLSGVQGVFLFSRYITNFLVEGKVCGIEGKKTQTLEISRWSYPFLVPNIKPAIMATVP